MDSVPNNRKAQQAMDIASIGVIAITLVVAAVILGMGGTILEKIQGVQTVKTATLLNNESISWAGNNTAISLQQQDLVSSSETLWNGTIKVNKGRNYTMDYVGGSITLLNETEFAFFSNQSAPLDLNITYSYTYGGPAFNSSGFGLTGVLTVAEFIPTIAIVAMAAIVIGILLVFFGRKKET